MGFPEPVARPTPPFVHRGVGEALAGRPASEGVVADRDTQQQLGVAATQPAGRQRLLDELADLDAGIRELLDRPRLRSPRGSSRRARQIRPKTSWMTLAAIARGRRASGYRRMRSMASVTT